MQADTMETDSASTSTPPPAAAAEEKERREFLTHLFAFMAERGTVINYIPIFDHRELDLYRLYKSVTARGGLASVVESKLWRQVTCELGVDQDRTDAGFRLRTHYTKYLYPYEQKFFLGAAVDDSMSQGEDDDSHLSSEGSSQSYGAVTPSSQPETSEATVPVSPTLEGLPSPKQHTNQHQRLAARRKLLRLRRNHHGHCSPPPITQPPFSPSSSAVIANSPLSLANPFSPPPALNPLSPISKPAEDPALSALSSLSKLEIATLIKYKSTFHLKIRSSASKEDLAAAVTDHYSALEIDELDTISSFFAALHKQASCYATTFYPILDTSDHDSSYEMFLQPQEYISKDHTFSFALMMGAPRTEVRGMPGARGMKQHGRF